MALSEFIISLYGREDVAIPIWAQIVAWVALSHGLLEFLSFTSIFILLPIKLVLVGKLKYKVASLLFMLLFLYIRIMYIPLTINLIPLDLEVDIPFFLREQSFYVIVISYALFGLFPIVSGFYAFFKQTVWRTRLTLKQSPPRISCIIPVYNEEIKDLCLTIYSVLNCDYGGPISVYCTFDDISVSPLYLALLKEFNIPLHKDLPKSVMVDINGRELIITRCDHGGKRVTQGNAWQLVQQRTPREQRPNHHVLLIDSDIVVDKDAIHNMSAFLEQNIRKKAITGYIGILKENWYNFFYHYQIPEYLQGQLVMRVMENVLGGVTCLPGALTMIRYSTLRRIGKVYFGQLNQKATLNYHRFYLGEDRYLTHLLMQNYERGATGMCAVAHAKTRAVTSFRTFLKQRRRWLLGAVSNEAWMIVSIELWQRVPYLLIWRMLEFCNRFMSAYTIAIAVFYLSGVMTNLIPVLFFSAPFLLQYFLVLIYSIRYRVVETIWSFPFLMIVMPFLYTVVYLYGIMTFFTRSWGGPRTDNNNNVDNADELYEEMLTDRKPRRIQNVTYRQDSELALSRKSSYGSATGPRVEMPVNL